MITQGKVTLVGAGPGGLDLLTLGGKRALMGCDVVLFDRLISQEILDIIPKKTERIDVGKTVGNHPMPQDKINTKLVTLAQEGKWVVRLKGGDNFLFGRGGEELALLQDKNIPFEVIPGVSSALAVPAFAGIPVTHRGVASSLHLFTGHKKQGEPLNFNYFLLKDLVLKSGTLVFLMSVSTAKEIMNGLLEAGLPPNTPSGVVEYGGRPEQRVFRSTVAFLADTAEKENIKSPSILLVGAVCALNFDWFSEYLREKPLLGRKILLSAPSTEENRMGILLQQEGAQVTIASTLHTEWISSKIPDLSKFTSLIFTSKRGVEGFFRQLEAENLDCRILSHLFIVVIGDYTKKTLKNHGILTDFSPLQTTGTSLAEEFLQKHSEMAKNTLIVVGSPSSESTQQVFQEKNIPYSTYLCYKTTTLSEKIKDTSHYDLVVFTSGATVTAFAESYPNWNHLTAVCIGETTQQRAELLGFHTKTAKTTSLEGVLSCVKEHFHKNTSD